MFPPGSPARALVDAFLDPSARLLVADEDAGSTAEGPQVRVAHEALLSHWPRAKAQIAADRRDLELLGRLESEARRRRTAEKRNRDSLVLSRGLPLTEAADLLRRWGAEISLEVADYVRQSQRVARRRLQRQVLAITGAMASLPVLAGVIWAFMVWRGVSAVEKEMEFVPIAQGCFVMGTPADEAGRFDHEVQHKVCVPAFELGKFAVTQEEWALVMVENPDPSRFKGKRNPVEMISWDDARAFVWRVNFFGSHAHRYRLPSEAEWEYAARAGTSTARFWGEKVEDGCPFANMRDLTYVGKHYNVGEAIVACHDGYDYTAPVGSFKPNQFGLFDMLGNVSQWTEDCLGPYASAPADGTPAEVADCKSRVVRGASWNDKPRFIRTGSRDTYAPTNRNDQVGFRLAR
jgi:formylglycine-generating enzyme required for sulfatase activity